jgi:hypothetical protein
MNRDGRHDSNVFRKQTSSIGKDLLRVCRQMTLTPNMHAITAMSIARNSATMAAD